MTDSIVSSLPRFDAPKGLSPLIVFSDQSGTIRSVEAIAEPPPAEEVVQDISVEPPPPDEEARFREQAEQMLERLIEAAGEMEASVVEKAAIAIGSIAQDIFPRFSSAFLLEEFALHLPDLIKLTPPVARIQAPPRIAQHLGLMSKSLASWPAGWTVEPAGELDAAHIEIVWDQGGLSYDPDKILAACLNRLGGHINDNEED